MGVIEKPHWFAADAPVYWETDTGLIFYRSGCVYYWCVGLWKRHCLPNLNQSWTSGKTNSSLAFTERRLRTLSKAKKVKTGRTEDASVWKLLQIFFFLLIVVLKNMKALDYILIWTQNTMSRPAFYYLQVLWSQNASQILNLIWNNAPKKSLLLTNVSLIFALFLVSTSLFSLIIITNKPPTSCYVAEYEVRIKSCQSQLKKENHMIKFWSANS